MGRLSTPGRFDAVSESAPVSPPVSRGLFVAYRVLAMVVGVLLAFCSLIVFPARHFAAEGSSLQQFGETWSILWVVHGWVFGAFAVFMWWRWLQEDVLGRPRRGAAVDAG